METECVFSKPEEVLRAFWTEMNAWELAAAKASPCIHTPETTKQWSDLMRTSWKPIFEKYCTPKKRTSSEYRGIGTPFYYDPNTENVLEMSYTSLNRVVIRTQRVAKGKKGYLAPEENYYVLYKRKGKWLIDNRYYYDDETIVRGTL